MDDDNEEECRQKDDPLLAPEDNNADRADRNRNGAIMLTTVLRFSTE